MYVYHGLRLSVCLFFYLFGDVPKYFYPCLDSIPTNKWPLIYAIMKIYLFEIKKKLLQGIAWPLPSIKYIHADDQNFSFNSIILVHSPRRICRSQ